MTTDSETNDAEATAVASDGDYETVDEAANAMDGATDETSNAERWFARLYIVTLIGVGIAILGALVHWNYIDLAVSISAHPQLGWVLEYFIAALFGLFIIFTVFMVIKAVGGHFLARVIKAGARIADSYELPNE